MVGQRTPLADQNTLVVIEVRSLVCSTACSYTTKVFSQSPMPRAGFEICNHTCGCTLRPKRPDPLGDCVIFQKEGSSGRRHARSTKKHPNCSVGCPAHGSTALLTRDPTMAEWYVWAAPLAQFYAHRRDLLAVIPPLCLPHTVNNSFSNHETISTSSFKASHYTPKPLLLRFHYSPKPVLLQSHFTQKPVLLQSHDTQKSVLLQSHHSFGKLVLVQSYC